MKLEQFTNCLPTEIHRWVVEKRPKLLVNAAKLSDEYAVLYKPFHTEQDNSWKSDDRNYSDKPEINPRNPFIRMAVVEHYISWFPRLRFCGSFRNLEFIPLMVKMLFPLW